jgi:hypothetical protein
VFADCGGAHRTPNHLASGDERLFVAHSVRYAASSSLQTSTERPRLVRANLSGPICIYLRGFRICAHRTISILVSHPETSRLQSVCIRRNDTKWILHRFMGIRRMYSKKRSYNAGEGTKFDLAIIEDRADWKPKTSRANRLIKGILRINLSKRTPEYLACTALVRTGKTDAIARFFAGKCTTEFPPEVHA